MLAVATNAQPNVAPGAASGSRTIAFHRGDEPGALVWPKSLTFVARRIEQPACRRVQ
jgi:hypothetical protein